MSADDGDESGPGRREVAHRLFAAEFDDADFQYSVSDEERAPNYVVTPTGLRVNRVFAVGVLTEVDAVNENTLRGRIVDPTGPFVTYAGQYQPDETAFLDRTDPPAFVALTGKARTFEPEDADVVYTSVRPESLSIVDDATRDRWTVSAAEATLRRVAIFARALEFDERGEALRDRLEAAGVPAAVAAGIPLALDHYGTGERYLEAIRRLAVDALEVVADERDEVRQLDAGPGASGRADLGPLPALDLEFDAGTASTGGDADTSPGQPAGSASEVAAVGEATEQPAVEGTAESEPATVGGAADDNDLGDFDAGDSVAEPFDDELGDFDTDDSGPTGEQADPDVDSFEQEEVLGDEEREEIEAEYGTDFATGSEVDDPGEADIATPAPEKATAEPDTTDEGESTTHEEGATTGGDVDLEEAAVAAMQDLDDGDGAPRDEVVAAVVDEHDVAAAEVDDAIQDALMSGKCYEPGEDRLKPI